MRTKQVILIFGAIVLSHLLAGITQPAKPVNAATVGGKEHGKCVGIAAVRGDSWPTLYRAWEDGTVEKHLALSWAPVADQ